MEILKTIFQQYPRPGDAFMDLLNEEGRIVAPGVYDAMGAYIAKKIHWNHLVAGKNCSFNAVYIGGWSISAMLWRRPDMAFHDRTMMAMIARHAVAEAYPLPTIVDAETGFSLEPVTIAETVRAYHEMGVGLAHLEDQATRRCGNLGGKACVEIEDMETKIRCWLMASVALGTSMRLMVRTDALTAANGGLENAIERGKRYMDVEYKGLRPAVLWADAMQDPLVIERWVTEMRRHDPKMLLGINYSPNKDWTEGYRKKFSKEPPTYDDLYDNGRGFRLIWHTTLQSRADMESTWNTFDHMADAGAESLWALHDRQRDHPVGDAQGMSGAKEWQELDQAIGGKEAAERYSRSAGYGSATREEKK